MVERNPDIIGKRSYHVNLQSRFYVVALAQRQSAPMMVVVAQR